MKVKKLVLAAGLILSMGLAWNCIAKEAQALEENDASVVATYEAASVKSDAFKTSKLVDRNTSTYVRSSNGGSITVKREDGIGFLYIQFDRLPQPWSIVDEASGVTYECGQQGFLHEYVKVEGLPTELRLDFPEGTSLSEVYAFSEGEVPDWVQVWEPPCEKADLLLISSHSDDEQLFFAGVLPYYGTELGYEVQVAYVIQHFVNGESENHVRPHEQLDGLWTVGVRHYPVIGEFPDLYAESKDRQTAFTKAEAAFLKRGYTYDDFVNHMVGLFRRFKPFVVVSHDLNGEYGHGTHVLVASAITDAIEAATDETAYTESADNYGVHQVEKVYLHLYDQNKIVMDWDIPLESFGGKTAFEVTRDGFACHKSQHWTWFYKWIYGKEGKVVNKATDITTYSPCQYGLYYTSVGFDEVGGDFFENVLSYAQRVAQLKEMRTQMQTYVYDRLQTAIACALQKKN